MRALRKRSRETGAPPPSDARLVRDCLRGKSEAWSALIDKYKNLIYSIPIKYGFSSEDATDLFQAVCLELLSELPRLRDARALPAWLIRVTSHKCFHLRHEEQRYVAQTGDEIEPPAGGDPPELPLDLVHQIECEQMLRNALAELSPRCRELIRMLFFETPARPYREAARTLGIATGSVGFIRGRCLERLRKHLEKAGFKWK
jgi:RNA polymerase sigma factor (sigma-70 family)